MDEVLYTSSREFYDLIKTNPKRKISFASVYEKRLIKYFSEDKISANNGKYWVKIPSKAKDEINYIKNLTKLRALSYKNWCTRGASGAAMHLSGGNFHILFDGYTPVIGIETRNDGTLIEIQDKYNTGQNTRRDYYEDVMDYVRISELSSIKEDIRYRFEG